MKKPAKSSCSVLRVSITGAELKNKLKILGRVTKRLRKVLVRKR